jgi:hypothetical protein
MLCVIYFAVLFDCFEVSEIEELLILVHVSINVLIFICAFDSTEHVTVWPTVIVLTVLAHMVMMFEQSNTRQSLPVMYIT